MTEADDRKVRRLAEEFATELTQLVHATVGPGAAPFVAVPVAGRGQVWVRQEPATGIRLPLSDAAVLVVQARFVGRFSAGTPSDPVGVRNPPEVIEQIAYLQFIRRLDDLSPSRRARRTARSSRSRTRCPCLTSKVFAGTSSMSSRHRACTGRCPTRSSPFFVRSAGRTPPTASTRPARQAIFDFRDVGRFSVARSGS